MPSSPARPEHHLLLPCPNIPGSPWCPRPSAGWGIGLAVCEPGFRVFFPEFAAPRGFSCRCPAANRQVLPAGPTAPCQLCSCTASRCSSHLRIRILLLIGASFSAGVRLQDIRFNGILLPPLRGAGGGTGAAREGGPWLARGGSVVELTLSAALREQACFCRSCSIRFSCHRVTELDGT